MLQEISDEVNGPTQAELVEIQLQLEEKHKAYKKKLKGWSDQLYRSMKGPNTYEGIFNKVVAETNAEERMDIAVYFDSFASFNRVKTQDNRKDYKNQFRLSKYKEGSFSGHGNVNMTDEQKENARLKRELKETQLENEILKKAVGIFSKSGVKNMSL